MRVVSHTKNHLQINESPPHIINCLSITQKTKSSNIHKTRPCDNPPTLNKNINQAWHVIKSLCPTVNIKASAYLTQPHAVTLAASACSGGRVRGMGTKDSRRRNIYAWKNNNHHTKTLAGRPDSRHLHSLRERVSMYSIEGIWNIKMSFSQKRFEISQNPLHHGFLMLRATSEPNLSQFGHIEHFWKFWNFSEICRPNGLKFGFRKPLMYIYVCAKFGWNRRTFFSGPKKIERLTPYDFFKNFGVKKFFFRVSTEYHSRHYSKHFEPKMSEKFALEQKLWLFRFLSRIDMKLVI
jgi:hypothetical protein